MAHKHDWQKGVVHVHGYSKEGVKELWPVEYCKVKDCGLLRLSKELLNQTAKKGD